MEDLKLADSEKCPLCGGKVLLGECSSCGYALPDTEQLSAPYDFDPANALFGEAAETVDDDDDIPSIGVPDISALPTLSQHRQAVRLKKQAEKDAEAANAANKPFVPYTPPVYSEPADPADLSEMPTRAVKAVSDFVFHHWWKFLAAAVIPSFGYLFAFFYFVINKDKDGKKSELVLAGAMLLTAILLQVVKWDPTGIDTIIQFFILNFLTRGRGYRYLK